MYQNIFLKSFLIGISIAAPVGPIGILCIQRTLARGRLSGFLSGLGAASADAMYGSISVSGLSFISSFLLGNIFWFKLIGGLFLIYLGVKIYQTPTTTFEYKPSNNNSNQGFIKVYLSTFLLTIANPLTILPFMAIFASLEIGLDVSTGKYAGVSAVSGIFLGSCSWWFLLSSITAHLRQRIGSNALHWINRISGMVITIFGAISLISLINLA
ncbi:MAG: LysE family transporter [Chloroflexota bacterium]|nr:MAG: LysE family transporter [Chloroflexota bacterium]